MALFKIYKGKAEFLPATRHEGYVYFTTDEGCLYVDINNETRVKVNAGAAYSLMDENDEIVAVEDLVKISDIIPIEQGGTGNQEGNAPSADKLKTPVTLQVNLASTESVNFDGSKGVKPGVDGILGLINGGTGGATAETARSNLDIYSKSETDTEIDSVTTTTYTATLATTGWVSNGDKFQYEYQNTALTCGKTGNVPPLITYTSNFDEYNTLESAEATPGTGILFIASAKPKNAIDLLIIDNK